MESEFLAIKKFLDSRAVDYKLFEHEPVFTSEDAARVRGEELRTGVKSLVFKAGDDFIIVLVPGDNKVDFSKLREVTNKREIRMATPDEVLKITGCEIGSVHPFGNLMGLPIFMDRSILRNDHVNFNVGLHTMTIRMSPIDLKNLISPLMCELSKG